MEASERAIQRAQCLLAEDSSVDSGSYYNVSAPDTILPAASPSASAPAVGAAASPAPAAAAAVGPLSLRMPQPLNAASGIAGAPSAALSSSSFGTSSQMAVFMSNHREVSGCDFPTLQPVESCLLGFVHGRRSMFLDACCSTMHASKGTRG